MNTSYRVGDNPDAVSKNRARLFSHLEIRPETVAIPGQCHSTELRVVTSGGTVENTDGLMTAVPDVWLAVSVADCVPIFMVDPEHRAVCAVHAGWRGSAGGILEKAVGRMTEAFRTDPRRLLVFLGPSAGKCCYEVGREVADQFDRSVVEHREGSIYLDLKAENRRQLRLAGVSEDNVETSEYCTICTPALFHSYRRDKHRSGRMMGIVGLVDGGT